MHLDQIDEPVADPSMGDPTPVGGPSPEAEGCDGLRHALDEMCPDRRALLPIDARARHLAERLAEALVAHVGGAA